MAERFIGSDDILFVGRGKSAISWYRSSLPALYLNCDWIGLNPSTMTSVNGFQRRETAFPSNAFDYKIIIWQQPVHQNEIDLISALRKSGVKVVIDCDDYLHGVRKMKDHDFRDAPIFSKKSMNEWEKTMRRCDGLILSTDYLHSKYKHHNKNAWVCKNGLDLGRYDLTLPRKNGINIGWAGATGHSTAFANILGAIGNTLMNYSESTFVSVGQPFAQMFASTGRAMSIPFTPIDVYPNAMTIFDFALAPARDSGWYRAKSALRYYEAAALGLPIIADPLIYSEVEHGVTGFLVEEHDDWEKYMGMLIENEDLRLTMGKAARQRAYEEFDMFSRRHQWRRVLEEVGDSIDLQVEIEQV